MWILPRQIQMTRRNTAGSNLRVHRGRRESRESQAPMEWMEKQAICTSNTVTMVERPSPGIVVKISALISEHAWTMQKMILRALEHISGQKSKARQGPKETRVIRVRASNRRQLHIRCHLPERRSQRERGPLRFHLHQPDNICGPGQLSRIQIIQRLRYTASVVWEPMEQMVRMERVSDR